MHLTCHRVFGLWTVDLDRVQDLQEKAHRPRLRSRTEDLLNRAAAIRKLGRVDSHSCSFVVFLSPQVELLEGIWIFLQSAWQHMSMNVVGVLRVTAYSFFVMGPKLQGIRFRTTSGVP